MNPLADAAACLLDWTADGAAGATGRCRFPADLPVFAGHFPAAPVLPGVHHLGAILVVCARASGRPDLRVAELRRVKWTRPVPPGAGIEVRVAWQEADDGLVVRGETRLDGGTSCQARLLLTD